MENPSPPELNQNRVPIFATPHSINSILKNGLEDLLSLDEANPDGPGLEYVPMSDDDEDIGSGDECWELDLLSSNRSSNLSRFKSNEAMTLPSAPNGMPPKPPKKEWAFDDKEMVAVPYDSEDEGFKDCEEDTTHSFVVPFHERVQIDYKDYTAEQLHPRTAKAKAMVRSLPGARQIEDATVAVVTGAVVTGTKALTIMNGRFDTAARLGCEAVFITGQVGSYLADEAWSAGTNLSIAIQENFPDMIRPLREGWDVAGGVLAEGVMMLPPLEAIDSGHRRRRI
ncbi:hypothetical protein G7Z17_g12427 [Cylindrodendrum hubeiense]|uniref:Uncharacterized protein n=1 Tax=Cylindrodendrum hubeiense TaxID=595255 RepID=A0A9P5H201_9HYPO|nr:hypothetical protein G7Z17_g12427 [Cylindrodendrum hubeiense]